MTFNPDDYVARGGPDDHFPDGVAEIVYCRFCNRPLLVRPDTEPDCGMHLN
jgi:hypothetical protein